MDTYEDIAREYNLFTKELLKFNDLHMSRPIEDGTIIYVEKKRTKGDTLLDKHIVDSGETLYDISQKYAIQLKSLCKINGLKEEAEISEGQEIKLR